MNVLWAPKIPIMHTSSYNRNLSNHVLRAKAGMLGHISTIKHRTPSRLRKNLTVTPMHFCWARTTSAEEIHACPFRGCENATGENVHNTPSVRHILPEPTLLLPTSFPRRHDPIFFQMHDVTHAAARDFEGCVDPSPPERTRASPKTEAHTTPAPFLVNVIPKQKL